MTHTPSRLRLLLPLTGLLLCACATGVQSTMLAGSIATGVMAHVPTSNIGQTYYLGVFDPREQLPPTIYRIRVQGQASALSSTNFASGWVRADVIDSLSGRIDIDKGKGVTVSSNGLAERPDDDKSELNRRLIMFGPEGFREAPRNHRLVVVMGSSPSSFFSAVDQALGVVASVTQPTGAGPDVQRALWADLSRMRQEQRGLDTMLELAAKP